MSSNITTQAASSEPASLQGRKVLIVEDEPLVAVLLEEILEEFGCSVVGPAAQLDQALELAGSADVDLAVLDVNLGGQPVFPVARVLSDRGVRFVFATGYGAGGLPPEWSHVPALQKPYTLDQVQQALGAVIAG